MRTYTINRLMEINPAMVGEILRYDEPHRFYHNWEHIEALLNRAMFITKANGKELSEELFLAIVFHDIIYNPKASDNEEQSANLLFSYIPNETVRHAILDTKTHKFINGTVSGELCRLDLEVLRGTYEDFVAFEHKIFKEYQFVDYKTYRVKRIEILKSLNVCPEFIDYVRHRRPSIAVYAGSFNPFHKGHLSILEKAEKIFDKVIIARGVNPEKEKASWDMPSAIQWRQVETYSGLLTDFIDSLGYEVTLIRGLRNATDLQEELTQYRFLQDLKPDIKTVSIFCDKEYEHISSRAIRQLKTFNKHRNYLIE